MGLVPKGIHGNTKDISINLLSSTLCVCVCCGASPKMINSWKGQGYTRSALRNHRQDFNMFAHGVADLFVALRFLQFIPCEAILVQRGHSSAEPHLPKLAFWPFRVPPFGIVMAPKTVITFLVSGSKTSNWFHLLV